MYLLDINVLIALGDPAHVHHKRARAWFLSPERRAWATCPITENGLIRILGQAAYPDFDGGPDQARAILDTLASLPGHQFWPDDLSLRDTKGFPQLSTSKHLTDLYLLALAAAHEGKFATFDQRVDPSLIPGGPKTYFFIP